MSEAFTAEGALRVLQTACEQVGLDHRGAELMRFGENATYRLATSPAIVARIARYPAAAAREVQVARWLADHDFPAIRLAEPYEQLLPVGDRLVTWWQFVESGAHKPTFVDLAGVLRRFHELPAPDDGLRTFEPMPLVKGRLASLENGVVDAAELDFLHELHEQLEQEYSSLEFALPPGPIHGDAHVGNLLHDRDTDTVRLLDFEVVSWGPREWDVSVLGASYQVFGWMDEPEYRECVTAYGWDSTTWSGFTTMRSVRELNMTTWLTQRLGESEKVDAEVHRRIADLRDRQAPRHWQRL